MSLDLIFADTPLPHSAFRSVFVVVKRAELRAWGFCWGQRGKILLAKEVLSVFLPADRDPSWEGP